LGNLNLVTELLKQSWNRSQWKKMAAAFS